MVSTENILKKERFENDEIFLTELSKAAGGYSEILPA